MKEQRREKVEEEEEESHSLCPRRVPSEHVPFSSQQMGSEVGKGVHCKSAPSATIHFGFAALAINVYNPWISASCPQTCIPSPSQPVFHVSALNLRRELGNSHS